MDFATWLLVGLLAAGNVGLSAWCWRLSKKPPKRFDASAQDLLHDLTRRGASILRVEVIDPAGLMLRSPRG